MHKIHTTLPEGAEQWNAALRMNVERELGAFNELLPRLLSRKRKGWFVAISGGRIVDEDRDEITLATRVTRRFKNEFVLVQKVAKHTD